MNASVSKDLHYKWYWSGYTGDRPFATKDHKVQNPPRWKARSLLFPHWDVKTKRPQPVKLNLPFSFLFNTSLLNHNL